MVRVFLSFVLRGGWIGLLLLSFTRYPRDAFFSDCYRDANSTRSEMIDGSARNQPEQSPQPWNRDIVFALPITMDLLAKKDIL